MFNRHVKGPAMILINAGFEAKLPLCEQWDEILGFDRTHPFSAVRSLEEWYALRTPGLRAFDQAFVTWLALW